MPVFRFGGREFYAWDLIQIVKSLVIKRKFDAATFSDGTWRLILDEYGVWERRYLPSAPIPKSALILDAGAGEGETILFFAQHGFRNFRAVELDQQKFFKLSENVKNWNVEGLNRPFRLEDLEGIHYAKIDIEGGEEVLLQLTEVPCEMVVEVHGLKLLDAFLRKWSGIEVLHKFSFPNSNITILRLRRGLP